MGTSDITATVKPSNLFNIHQFISIFNSEIMTSNELPVEHHMLQMSKFTRYYHLCFMEFYKAQISRTVVLPAVQYVKNVSHIKTVVMTSELNKTHCSG